MAHWDRIITGTVAVWLLAMSCSGAADAPTKPLRGAEFRVAWNKGVKAKLDQQPLQLIMGQLCTSRRMAWVVDRRLDPDQLLNSPLIDAPLSEFLPQVLEAIHADAVVVGSTVIVGPAESICWLRTLTEQKRIELQSRGWGPQRVQQLSKSIELKWGELAEPKQLVTDVAKRAKLELSGIEAIPYDLWNAGQLQDVSVGEALTIVAWQYGQQLNWGADGKASLVPLTVPIQIERNLVIPEQKREAVTTRFPDLAIQPEGKLARVSGRVEDLEALESWLKGGTFRPRMKQPESDWRKRVFDLTLNDAPLIDVLKRLQLQGLPIQFDEEALAAAGVDLNTRLRIELQKATADELLQALCEPAGLQYHLDSEKAEILPPE